jgi:hypothetical protein
MVERGKTVFDVAVWINLTPLGLKQVEGKGLSELEGVLEEVGLRQSRARSERWSIRMVGRMPFGGTATGTEVFVWSDFRSKAAGMGCPRCSIIYVSPIAILMNNYIHA